MHNASVHGTTRASVGCLRDHVLAVVAILGIFLARNFVAMMQQNAFWRSGAWYEFLERPSAVSQAGLLDPAAMGPYYKTLSISAGHQLIAAVNRWMGFDLGTAFLYGVTAAIVTTAFYLLALHWTRSRLKAFVVAMLMVNTDVLAMAHIGACGSLAQGPARDYMALGPILLAAYFLLERRPYAYTACLYAAFLLHLPHGIYAFALFLPLTALRILDRRFLVIHGCLFLATALALYAYQSSASVAIDAQVRALWFKWVYMFNGGHIFFDHSIDYLIPNWAFFAVLFAGLALAFAVWEHRMLVFTMVGVWTLIAVATTLLIYVAPTMLVYQLTPYRSSFSLAALLLVLLLAFSVDQIGSTAWWRKAIAAIGLGAVLTGTFFGVTVFALTVCVLVMVDRDGRARVLPAVAAVGCVVMLALCLREYRAYDDWVFAQGRKVWLAALIAVGAFLAVRAWRPELLARRKVEAIVPVLVLVLTASFLHSRYVARPTPESREKLEDYLAASRVIRENSTEAEPVLAAPLIDMPMLEVTAGRGSILQLVKAHVPYLAPGLLPVFDRTLRGIGIDVASFNGTWVDLVREAPQIWRRTATVERLQALGAEHKARVVVTYRDHPLGLPVLYEGKHFAVYRLAP